MGQDTKGDPPDQRIAHKGAGRAVAFLLLGEVSANETGHCGVWLAFEYAKRATFATLKRAMQDGAGGVLNAQLSACLCGVDGTMIPVALPIPTIYVMGYDYARPVSEMVGA